MRRALKLAEKGRGFTEPNPMVGAVIVKEGEKIGEGWHRAFGGDHAEVDALKNCSVSAKGATLYVTLEPCCHQGKTPPCTEAIIAAGISKVVVAVKDPSEKVNGQGIAQLQAAGIEVELGLMSTDAHLLNAHFFAFHQKGRPFVTLKWAQSLDSKIGVKGEKLMLSSEPSLNFAHALRAEHAAIVVGAETVLNDDPELTVRRVPGQNPLRVVLKGEKKLPKKLRIFNDEHVLILENATAESALKTLAEQGISSVLIEGGAQVLQSFIDAGFWDEAVVIVAPMHVGEKGVSAPLLPENPEILTLKSRILGKDAVFHFKKAQ